LSSELWFSIYIPRAAFDSQCVEEAIRNRLHPADRPNRSAVSRDIQPGARTDYEHGRLLIPYLDTFHASLSGYYQGVVTNAADHLHGLIEIINGRKYLHYSFSLSIWGGKDFLRYDFTGWTWKLGWLVDCPEALKFFSDFSETFGASVGVLWYSGGDACRVVPGGQLVSKELELPDDLKPGDDVDFEASRLLSLITGER
jgi:hypothetical protein